MPDTKQIRTSDARRPPAEVAAGVGDQGAAGTVAATRGPAAPDLCPRCDGARARSRRIDRRGYCGACGATGKGPSSRARTTVPAPVASEADPFAAAYDADAPEPEDMPAEPERARYPDADGRAANRERYAYVLHEHAPASKAGRQRRKVGRIIATALCLGLDMIKVAAADDEEIRAIARCGELQLGLRILEPVSTIEMVRDEARRLVMATLEGAR